MEIPGKSCNTSTVPSKHASAMLRQGFLLNLPGCAIFNQQVRLDLFWLDDKEGSHPGLRIVETATHLQTATFLSGDDSHSSATDLFGWPLCAAGVVPTLVTLTIFSLMLILYSLLHCLARWVTSTASPLHHTNEESRNFLGEGEKKDKGLRKVF